MVTKNPATSEAELEIRRDQLFESLDKESDRGILLVGTAFIDEALEGLLRENFVRRGPGDKSIVDSLFETFASLSSFSAKIKVAYATGLIETWAYKDLEILRTLRNKLAHSFGTISFGSADIAALTQRLEGANVAVQHITKYGIGKDPEVAKESHANANRELDKSAMERARTVMSISYIAAMIYFKSVMWNQLRTGQYPKDARETAP